MMKLSVLTCPPVSWARKAGSTTSSCTSCFSVTWPRPRPSIGGCLWGCFVREGGGPRLDWWPCQLRPGCQDLADLPPYVNKICVYPVDNTFGTENEAHCLVENRLWESVKGFEWYFLLFEFSWSDILIFFAMFFSVVVWTSVWTLNYEPTQFYFWLNLCFCWDWVDL